MAVVGRYAVPTALLDHLAAHLGRQDKVVQRLPGRVGDLQRLAPRVFTDPRNGLVHRAVLHGQHDVVQLRIPRLLPGQIVDPLVALRIFVLQDFGRLARR